MGELKKTIEIGEEQNLNGQNNGTGIYTLTVNSTIS